MWIFIALGSSLFYGFSNVLDNYLTNRLFKSIWILVFFGFCINLVFLPLTYFIAAPQLPPLRLVPFILCIGFLEVVYLFPYYKALQEDDTSVVSSLFSFGRIFLPVFAFFILGEVLRPDQYLGFFLIILSGGLLTLKDFRHLHLNRSFFYMLVVSFILSLDSVLYKHVLNEASWGTTYIWVILSSFFFSACFLIHPKIRKGFRLQLQASKQSFGFLALEEFMNFGGSVAATYTLSLVPVTLARSIGAIFPFIILFYAVVLQKFFPKFFHENIDKGTIVKKIILFSIVLAGVFLVVRT